MRQFIFGLLLLAASIHAQAADWGALDHIAKREWTTEKEPRPRVTKFRWIEPGRVLEARHGFVSRLQFGEAKFADTVQRFVLDPKTGLINVTYTYEDGRPPLKAVIKIGPDGNAVETFTDAKGVRKRNIYTSPSLSVNAIERQELRNNIWVSLGTTRKAGLTQLEIAENKRRAEEARQRAIAEENARIAAEQERQRIEMAQREAEEAAYAAQQAQMQQQPMYNPLDALNAIANSINSGSGVYGGSSYGGSSYGGGSSSGRAIIIDSLSNPMDGTPPQKPPRSASDPYAPGATYTAPVQGQSGDSCRYWHRPRAGDREYEQCAKGDENCTCGDASSVSPQ